MKKLLFGILAGLSAGLLFAPKSGKKLREQLKKSDAKLTDFGNALLEAAKDAGDEVKTCIESEEVQKMLTSGKKNIDDFVRILEKKGGELSKKARMEFDTLLDEALEAAEQTKKTVEKKAKTLTKAAKKKAATTKKAAAKKVKAVKKEAEKKVKTIKKTAKKKGKICHKNSKEKS